MQTYEQKAAKRVGQVRARVRKILDQYPETRDNDQILVIRYLEDVDIIGWSKLMDAAKRQSFSFESIRRARQFIQAAGQYLPSDPAVIKRRKLQAVYETMMTKREMI